MTHNDNLIALRDAVKAGGVPSAEPTMDAGLWTHASHMHRAISLQSLDAALKFKDAVLPDVPFALAEVRAGRYRARFRHFNIAVVRNDSLATALILACLEALIAQTADNGEGV